MAVAAGARKAAPLALRLSLERARQLAREREHGEERRLGHRGPVKALHVGEQHLLAQARLAGSVEEWGGIAVGDALGHWAGALLADGQSWWSGAPGVALLVAGSALGRWRLRRNAPLVGASRRS